MPSSPRAVRDPHESRFAFTLATDADDAELRALLAAHPFDGEIRVTLEREPRFAAARAIDGDISDTIVARDRTTGRIVAMGTRSEREVYINGKPGRIGYLGQLRIVPAYRGQRHLLLEGFAACRALHDTGRVAFYLASVVADNDRASRLLTSSRLQQGPAALPRFDPYARIETVLLPTTPARSVLTRSVLGRSVPAPPPMPLPGALRSSSGRGRGGQGGEGEGALRVARGTAALRPAIAVCLARNQPRFQFASQWHLDAAHPARASASNTSSASHAAAADDLTSGPSIDDFFIAFRRDRLVGCLARWDQRAFKQVRVRGYAPRLARWRPLINVVAPLLGAPRLPRVGESLPFAYLSHVAIDDDDPVVLRALVDAARAVSSAPTMRTTTAAAPLDYLVVGLAERHPLLAAFTGMRVRRYISQLYLVSWDDGRAAIDALDGRLPHVEVATL